MFCLWLQPTRSPPSGESSWEAAQIVARIIQHHSPAFTILVLKNRTKSEPWPSPRGRTSLQREAGLLESEVQERLAPEEQAGGGEPSSLQLQWATQTARPSIVWLFDLNRCAIPLSAVGDGGIFAVPAVAVSDLDSRTQGGTVNVPLTDGSRGAAHFSDSYAIVFIEITSELEGQLEVVAEVPEHSWDSHKMDVCSISRH